MQPLDRTYTWGYIELVMLLDQVVKNRPTQLAAGNTDCMSRGDVSEPHWTVNQTR